MNGVHGSEREPTSRPDGPALSAVGFVRRRIDGYALCRADRVAPRNRRSRSDLPHDGPALLCRLRAVGVRHQEPPEPSHIRAATGTALLPPTAGNMAPPHTGVLLATGEDFESNDRS